MDIDPLCAERCAYGTCMAARTMYGCGGCCGCLGGCQVAYENEGASQFAAARLFAFMAVEGVAMTRTDVDPMCAERCAYGSTCTDAGLDSGLGCGSCCGCRGGCEVTWEKTRPHGMVRISRYRPPGYPDGVLPIDRNLWQMTCQCCDVLPVVSSLDYAQGLAREHVQLHESEHEISLQSVPAPAHHSSPQPARRNA